nr:rhodanese-like domain-containing protein [Planctomycetota bacterium]
HEIVTMGQRELTVPGRTGSYVDPADWDALIAREDVVLVDTRNDYECAEGRFAGAIEPDVHTFREFPAWVAEHLDPEQQPAVAMYCTGGIRCEKATALLRERGFAEVYHLQGGILNYFEQTGNASGNWQGRCFVFDERETVDAKLTPAPAVSRDAFPQRE